ncbi:MAG: lipase [Corynebacterium casei]|nr:lipase [Corynebacterium casei]
MPENTPESQKHVLSNQERVERAEQSTQNSFEQYSGSKTTDRWMWIVGVGVVVLAVAAALFAWIRSNAEPNAQPVVDRAVVDVDSSAPVEILNGGYVGTFAGEFNASPENTWDGVISFAGETAVLVYPTTGCQALLTLMETDGAEEGVAAYDTQALNNKCVTDGFWKFEEDSGQISAQYFETNEAGDEELKAAATLTRDIDELVVAPE